MLQMMFIYVFFVLMLLNTFTEEKVIPDTENCKDRSRICATHKKNGYCDSRENDKIYLMQTNCKMTCGYCTKKEKKKTTL
ncbi:hypothetical protein GCK32_013205 [Trichostrongylus colubriformis]|uniref:ShKT domain-containing protein n=1 Tax=Trichostrongylus colubriformis TaxID=6319 RepID=A0AAN8FBS4_TRICO